MQADWMLATALLGGTRAMRAAGKTYLPQWPNEDDKSYQTRLQTSTLFPAFKRTVETLTGKPFSKPITVGDDVPEIIKEWTEDVDLEGRNLDAFAADVMEHALAHGICGILVDHPVKPEGVKTQADEKAIKLRPYFVHVKANQLIGWVASRVNGEWTILQLRILECVEEPDGGFGTTEIQQIRVLEPGKWSTYRKNKLKPEQWDLFDNGVTTLDFVPFVPVYGQRTGFMTGKSPLIELAFMNVEHWQSASDQRTILHVARVPILTIIGIDDDKFKLTIGASAAVKIPLGGDMKYVEHTGAAITAGQSDLDKLEERMVSAGSELISIRQTGPKTATQVSSENEGNKCALQRITSALDDALNLALEYMAIWVGLEEGGHVNIFKDFAAILPYGNEMTGLLSAVQMGLISKKTAIIEMKRRGILAPEVDSDIEQEEIDAQGPNLGALDPNKQGQES
jgi:hypothetical protein